MSDTSVRYLKPHGFEVIVNKALGLMPKLGINAWGARTLAVRGRKSGEWKTVPVNLLPLDGERYLVAPRGHTQWVRNIRVAGGGELRLGRKAEPFTVTELPDDQKLPVLRRYLERWGWEVGQFFEGITKDSTDEQLTEIAPGFPVFRVNR
ncbi:MAG TPA: nitroreductase/quinone reductase family protein [Actinocrinis sp.]|nr:nitroreductase/quinone reductase family protein [Actinocrinis sp.]